MIEGITPDLLVTIGVILGVLTRTLLPWLKKKATDPTIPFDPKFGYTAILALITTGIEIATVLSVNPNQLAVLGTRFALLAGFFFGLGNNEIWNRILHKGKG